MRNERDESFVGCLVEHCFVMFCLVEQCTFENFFENFEKLAKLLFLRNFEVFF